MPLFGSQVRQPPDDDLFDEQPVYERILTFPFVVGLLAVGVVCVGLFLMGP